MEHYFTIEAFVIGCIITALLIFSCCYIYLIKLRITLRNTFHKNFLQLVESLQKIEEGLLSSDDPLIFNTSTETTDQFKSRFDQLVMTPIYTAWRFTGMFSRGEKRHRYTVMILKQFRFSKQASRIIETYLETLRDSYDYIKFDSAIRARHPKMIQSILQELIHPDLQYKIEKWQAPSPENV
jgi:hypothetical protein